MLISSFLEIAIVGVVLSGIIQGIKLKFGTDSFGTKMLTVTLALAAGAGYWYLSSTSYWESVIGVLGAASAFYAFVLKRSS